MTMKKICMYGKGGIGKSIISSNLAAVMAADSKAVLLIGCDPKADTTKNIMGRRIPTVLDTMRKNPENIFLDDIVFKGFHGVRCVESGGPEPGVGCAGRGIITASELLRKLDAFTKICPDIVIYDVLGDVVCGGFAMPLRTKMADEAYIVTTCDPMAIYAANNICKGIRRYAEKGGVPLGGIIYNGRSRIDEPSIIDDFAARLGTRVIGRIPMSLDISKAELKRQTVIEHKPDSEVSKAFSATARAILNNDSHTVPNPLTDEELDDINRLIDEMTDEL